MSRPRRRFIYRRQRSLHLRQQQSEQPFHRRGKTEILDLHQEQGTVFDLVEKASLYILNNTRRRFVINDVGPRDEIPELPQKA